MRLSAYILAADPAWIEASVLSYYELVEEIIVSYDENGRGYTGAPIAVEECLSRLKAIDSKGKLRYCSGHYARLEHTPMENETYQRQCALSEVSDDMEWVLQLDTDEVVADSNEFLLSLNEAALQRYNAMEYPARWLYKQLSNGRYLEACSRFWSITASYPGPVAIQVGTFLRMARQCDGSPFRVDFRSRNTDPWRTKDTPVHRVIKPHQGILHYSCVRSEAELLRKYASWSHATDQDWSSEFDRWVSAEKHPYLIVLKAPFMSKGLRNRLRIATISKPLL